MSCETCGGGGWRIEFRTYAGEAFAGEPYEVPCPDCDGEEDEPLCQGCDGPLDARGYCWSCECFPDDGPEDCPKCGTEIEDGECGIGCDPRETLEPARHVLTNRVIRSRAA